VKLAKRPLACAGVSSTSTSYRSTILARWLRFN